MSQTGQIAVPKMVRDEMGIRPSEVLKFFEEGGMLVGQRYDGALFDDGSPEPEFSGDRGWTSAR